MKKKLALILIPILIILAVIAYFQFGDYARKMSYTSVTFEDYEKFKEEITSGNIKIDILELKYHDKNYYFIFKGDFDTQIVKGLSEKTKEFVMRDSTWNEMVEIFLERFIKNYYNLRQVPSIKILFYTNLNMLTDEYVSEYWISEYDEEFGAYRDVRDFYKTWDHYKQ